MSSLPPLPTPDTHCLDDDYKPPIDVWSHSAEQMKQYGKSCAEAMREKCAHTCEAMWGDGDMNDAAQEIRSLEVE